MGLCGLYSSFRSVATVGLLHDARFYVVSGSSAQEAVVRGRLGERVKSTQDGPAILHLVFSLFYSVPSPVHWAVARRSASLSFWHASWRAAAIAIDGFHKAIDAGYANFIPYADLAAVYALKGRTDEMRTALIEARRLNPYAWGKVDLGPIFHFKLRAPVVRAHSLALGSGRSRHWRSYSGLRKRPAGCRRRPRARALTSRRSRSLCHAHFRRAVGMRRADFDLFREAEACGFDDPA
jgi:hypothetical protein